MSQSNCEQVDRINEFCPVVEDLSFGVDKQQPSHIAQSCDILLSIYAIKPLFIKQFKNHLLFKDSQLINNIAIFLKKR